ncbi:MAG: hypothetical protein WCJ35_12040 [Planctomycetota bacterium]
MVRINPISRFDVPDTTWSWTIACQKESELASRRITGNYGRRPQYRLRAGHVLNHDSWAGAGRRVFATQAAATPP